MLALELPQGALSLAAFARARQLTDDGTAALLADRDLLIVGDRALAQEQVQQAESRLLQVLAEYHQQHADQLGLGRARLRRMGLPQQPEALVFMIIERLLKAGALRNTRGWLHLPEHGTAFSAEEAPLWARIEPLFGDEPWWVRDLASELGEEESRVRALLRKAAQLGHVTAVVVDRYYLSRRIDQFAALIRELDAERGGANAADFRDRLGVGRKLAIRCWSSSIAAVLPAARVTSICCATAGCSAASPLADKPDGGPAHVGRLGDETPVSVRSAAVSPTPPAKPDSSRRRCARRRHKAAPITPPQWFAGSAPDPRSRCRARRWPPHCPVPANQIHGRVQDRAGPRCRFCSQRRQSRRSGEGWISGQAARSRCPSASSAGAQIGISHSSNSLAAAVLAPKWPLPSRMAQS